MRFRARTLAASGAGLFALATLAACGSDQPLDTSPAALAMRHEPSEPSDTTPPPPTAAGHGPGELVLYSNPKHASVRVAAGDGHVVAVVARAKGSDLVDVTAGARPRTIAHLDGGVTPPSMGTDAAGRDVVVLSPCRDGSDPSASRCGLVEIDVGSGKGRTLPGTTGASLGDSDQGRLAIVTGRPGGGAAYATQSSAGGAFTPVPFTDVNYRGTPYANKPVPSEHVESIDFRDGVLATVSLFDGDDGDGGGSTVLTYTAPAGWRGYQGTGYGLMDGVEVAFRAVELTPTGVRAYADGGAEAQPYVARWTLDGHRQARIGVKSRIGTDQTAAFDGDHLITAGKRDAQSPLDTTDPVDPIVRSGPYDLG